MRSSSLSDIRLVNAADCHQKTCAMESSERPRFQSGCIMCAVWRFLAFTSCACVHIPSLLVLGRRGTRHRERAQADRAGATRCGGGQVCRGPPVHHQPALHAQAAGRPSSRPSISNDAGDAGGPDQGWCGQRRFIATLSIFPVESEMISAASAFFLLHEFRVAKF